MSEVPVCERDSHYPNTWKNYANCIGIDTPTEFGERAQTDAVAAVVCSGCVERLAYCPAGPTDDQLIQLGVKTAS